MKAKGFRQNEYPTVTGKVIVIEEVNYEDENDAIFDQNAGVIDYYEVIPPKGRNIADELMGFIKDITDDYRMNHLFNNEKK